MEREEIRSAILHLVRDPGYRPLKPKAIARRLDVPPEQARDVRKVVKRMVLRGELRYAANHFVLAGEVEDAPPLPAAREVVEPRAESIAVPEHWIIGTFRRHEKGFGFVRPRDAGGAPTGEADIYVAADRSRDAATGDLVAVELIHRGRPGPGLRGQIVRILERDRRQFVGTYYERGSWGVVAVDGAVFSQPVSVGDPSATSARPGDKVVIEMVRFPSHQHDGEGVITEILGERGTPGVDTLMILREFGLPDRFDEPVRLAARKLVEAFDEERLLDGRHDATGETVVTIDPPDARDFDDAISLVRQENGHWRLGVHIADVSHFVQPDTALDQEARERGTSVYLPDRVIPMLPEVLSNGLASLQPDRLRLTKSVYIEFTADGARVATEARNTVIRSRRRLTYEEVDGFLDDPEPLVELWGPDVHGLLGRMYELAMILRRRRFRRGALELTLPEVKIVLDELGNVSGARVYEQTEANQIIEEFMLAANEAVAELLADAGTPFLRRVHKPPSLRKMRVFGEFVAELFRARRAASEPSSEAANGFYASPEGYETQEGQGQRGPSEEYATMEDSDEFEPDASAAAMETAEDDLSDYRELDWEPEDDGLLPAQPPASDAGEEDDRSATSFEPRQRPKRRSEESSEDRCETPGVLSPDFDFTADPTSLASRFALQELLRAVQGRPEEKAVNYFLLRSLQRAEYAPRDEGHYALASPCYCHFTSPIRRYPDLTVHRLLERHIQGKRPHADFDEMTVLGAHCSDREERAERAERELTKLKLLDYMSRRIGHRMTGVITGVESFGLFIQGTEIPAEGLAHVDSLTDDYYRFDRATYTLSGYRTGNTYRLGDLVRVVIARVDMERRELDFRVVGRIVGVAPPSTAWEQLPPLCADKLPGPPSGRSETERRPGRGRKRRGVFVPDESGNGRRTKAKDPSRGKTRKSKNGKKSRNGKGKRKG